MKLFVFDVDGTLISRSGRFRKSTINALNNKLINGDIIAIASGRPYIGIKKFLDKLAPGKKFAVAANGAATYYYDGKVIDVCGLTYQDYEDLYAKYKYLVDEQNATILCYTLTTVGYFKNSMMIRNESSCNNNIPLQNFNKEPINDPKTPLLKIMFCLEKEKMKDVDLKEVKEKFNVVSSSNVFHEVINKNADKVRGVEAIRNLYGLKKEDCYCFGDEMNDYMMIKNYNGVAMGNALQKVKDVAHIITKTVNEDGVSFALNELIK